MLETFALQLSQDILTRIMAALKRFGGHNVDIDNATRQARKCLPRGDKTSENTSLSASLTRLASGLGLLTRQLRMQKWYAKQLKVLGAKNICRLSITCQSPTETTRGNCLNGRLAIWHQHRQHLNASLDTMPVSTTQRATRRIANVWGVVGMYQLNVTRPPCIGSEKSHVFGVFRSFFSHGYTFPGGLT